MKSVQEAQRIILDSVCPGPVETVLLEDAVGCVLAEDVVSRISIPPFNKSAMDGYAVRAEDVEGAPVELSIAGTVAAGEILSRKIGEGECAKIMTGAPLPEGANAVVRVEDSRPLDAGRVRIEGRCKRGDNVCMAGEDLPANRVALKAGETIRGQEVLLLATAGAAMVKVFQKPSAAFFATGSELIPPLEKPKGGKIRDSNSSLITVRIREMGIPFRSFGIVEDREEVLRARIREGLNFDFLLLTGGVSMGEYDIVAKAFQEEGVEILFDTLALKPGRPFTFGRKGKALAFGLPGNPVTVFVCFELFVRPAILKRLGRKNPLPFCLKVPFRGREERIKKNGRDSFLPALLQNEEGALRVSLVEWHGPGDIVGLSRSNCLLHIPPGTQAVFPGAQVEVLLIGGFNVF